MNHNGNILYANPVKGMFDPQKTHHPKIENSMGQCSLLVPLPSPASLFSLPALLPMSFPLPLILASPLDSLSLVVQFGLLTLSTFWYLNINKYAFSVESKRVTCHIESTVRNTNTIPA